ncbi:MAG: hypothetical protein CR988_07200 [Treponema sp.]|nr:MAG: hypothetical protein CR988_07200 [Treponema sp.]
MNSKLTYNKIFRKAVIACLILLFLFATLCTCKKDDTQNSKLEKINLNIKKSDGTVVPVKTELAKTREEQAKGFMHRKNIPSGTGMLFIYTKDTKLAFWMKNTPTPLSIAFIDSTGKIREIFDMTPFSTASIKSTYSVRYALEVPKGWFAENDITCGDILDISKLK